MLFPRPEPLGRSTALAVTSVPVLLDKNFHYFSKIFLHLWKFAVISKLRTNFAENARESLATLGAA